MNHSTERYVTDGTAQLAVASANFDNGNTTTAQENLMQFRSTLQSLRDSYRKILMKEDLSKTTARDVLSMALDSTAARLLAMRE
ncbi:MAG: hypothetical protein WCF90_01750 [Methanomicrobiales archaeon]